MSDAFIVLGAGGYLGREVVPALEARGPGRVQVARDLDAHRAGGGRLDETTTVINCAGATGSDTERLRAANVDLAARTAELTAAAGARLVHVSSAAVFDAVRAGELSEERVPAARSAYGQSKLAGERAVRAAHTTACLLRPSKVFGGDDPRKRLHALAAHVRSGRPLPLPSRPVLWANFLWVADAGRVVADLVLGPERLPEVVHLSAGVSWPRFTTLLGEALGRPVVPFGAAASRGFGALARTVEALPPARRARSAERVLEIWDRQHLVDTAARLTEHDLRAGLADLAERTR